MTEHATTVPDDPAALLALAARLAREAGQIALDGRAEIAGRVERTTKSTQTDLVTAYDHAAEAHVVGTLRRLRPGDAIAGEEGAAVAGSSGYTWLVDPIDGTTNFVYGHHAWACSVGVAHAGAAVAGAVYVPPVGELFAAAAGAGATLNGRPIRAGDETDVALALVGTGFGYRAEQRRAQGELLARLIGRVRDVRRLGSAAIDLCMVACGRLDAYYEQHLNPWDIAAGELIAREAGAVTSDFAGGAARPAELVAAAPGVHAGLLAALAAARPRHDSGFGP